MTKHLDPVLITGAGSGIGKFVLETNNNKRREINSPCILKLYQSGGLYK
jgi:hypothetical protein